MRSLLQHEQLRSQHRLLHLHLGSLFQKDSTCGTFYVFLTVNKSSRCCPEAVTHPHTGVRGFCSRDGSDLDVMVFVWELSILLCVPAASIHSPGHRTLREQHVGWWKSCPLPSPPPISLSFFLSYFLSLSLSGWPLFTSSRGQVTATPATDAGWGAGGGGGLLSGPRSPQIPSARAC